MIVSKTFICTPGSPEAQEFGCTCKQLPHKNNPDLPPDYLVDPNCPIHWNLDIIQMQGQFNAAMEFIHKIDRSHRHLMSALICLFIFVVCCYFGITPGE